ncbi:DUF6404 family protein [Photobacterium sp. SDRW27]|uniref:DUF6404 family protein n=1 Tax=Photobacterium obscurum TaxID=2829490 RepID=UPI002244CA52|nr:DUF6404 family protein [Photobacterium obscurum]MCW8330140.1 DUF6404 family protein [Photobacterium obscurum]
MHKKEFIEVYLRQKGASRAVVKPYPFIWHWLFKSNAKPCLFESPLKLFFLQLVFGTVTWGGFMWLMVWRLQEPSINNLYISLFFGFTSGLWLSLEVLYYSKKLKLTSSWEEWLKEHHLPE